MSNAARPPWCAMARKQGEYIIGMYLDNLPAIAAGRELSAFPKKLGSAKLFVDSDTLVGTLDYGMLSVARATMGYKHKPYDLEKARQEICVPTYMLKILPSYTKRPRICELVRTQITNISSQGRLARPGTPAAVRARACAAGRPAGARDRLGHAHPHRSHAFAGHGHLRLPDRHGAGRRQRHKARSCPKPSKTSSSVTTRPPSSAPA